MTTILTTLLGWVESLVGTVFDWFLGIVTQVLAYFLPTLTLPIHPSATLKSMIGGVWYLVDVVVDPEHVKVAAKIVILGGLMLLLVRVFIWAVRSLFSVLGSLL